MFIQPTPVATFNDYIQINSGALEKLEIYKTKDAFELVIRDGDTGEILQRIDQNQNGTFYFKGHYTLKTKDPKKPNDTFLDECVIHTTDQKRTKGQLWYMQTQIDKATPTAKYLDAKYNINDKDVQGFDISSDRENEGIAYMPNAPHHMVIVSSMNIKK